jgi:hypothetical protein
MNTRRWGLIGTLRAADGKARLDQRYIEYILLIDVEIALRELGEAMALPIDGELQSIESVRAKRRLATENLQRAIERLNQFLREGKAPENV